MSAAKVQASSRVVGLFISFGLVASLSGGESEKFLPWRIELGSSVDLQLKKVLELGSTFGEVVSETLLLEARPQAFRVPGLEPGDVGFEVEL